MTLPVPSPGRDRPTVDAAAEGEGLTSVAAAARLEESGPNEPFVRTKTSSLRRAVHAFASPLVAILVVACVISASLGDVVNAALILSMVGLGVAIEQFQTHKSERAAAALADRVRPTATVLRDGKWNELATRAIVEGDVCRLTAGDLIPADGRALRAKDLHLQEAAITGESLPVEKVPGEPLFMGSSVVSGTGTMVVSATGPRTTFGQIAKTLARRAPPTEFELGIARFGSFILKTVAFLIAFVFVVAAASHRDPLQALLFALALAVGLTPEFLPMITSVTLARGAVRMSKRNVIVKNLAAIQNLGSIDVLCSDKTGTLTLGKMALERHVDPFGVESERPLLLACVNAYFESGVDDAMGAAVLAKAKVDPIDAAVLAHEHPGITGFRKLDEVPFDFERKRVSVLVTRGPDTLWITKGAPENVLGICTSYELGGDVAPLDPALRSRFASTYDELGGEGFRVLGVARSSTTSTAVDASERDLVLVGFLAFADPVRSDAAEVIASLAAAGVKVKVLSGDNERVTAHVCRAVGLRVDTILLGTDIARLTEPALAVRAEQTDVFARLSPAQKNRTLAALRRRGHVVGFMGDGINDAPSLHDADVGISVSGAVDVAKDAADVILLEPGLGVVREGIVEGRRAFGNVMKYLLMGTSSSFGNMFSMAGAIVFLPFLPMLPQQILLGNFLYDLSQITIPSDDVDASFVRRPRKWNIDAIRRFMLWLGPVSSIFDLLTFVVLLRVFHSDPSFFHTGWFVESLATQTLVIFVIRTMGNPLKSRPSRALAVTTIAVVALGVALPYLPFAHALGFVPLPASYLLFVAVVTATYLLVVEVVKRRVIRRVMD